MLIVFTAREQWHLETAFAPFPAELDGSTIC
jgi:hypothetical protein